MEKGSAYSLMFQEEWGLFLRTLIATGGAKRTEFFIYKPIDYYTGGGGGGIFDLTFEGKVNVEN